LTGGQQHIGNLTLELFGQAVRHSSQRNKKIKTPPPHKKIKFYPPQLHTFAIACQYTSQPEGKGKRVQSPTLYPLRSMTDVHDKTTSLPKTRTEWGLHKIERNKQLDLENLLSLKNETWKVFSIFECELKNDKREKALSKLLMKLNKMSTQ